MKRKYLVATHGELASGFQSSLNILADKGNCIEVIDAYVTNEDFTPQISQFIEGVANEEQAVIFTDLYGGSVNQKIVTEAIAANQPNIFIISNANLAILLSIVFLEGKLTHEKIEQAITESQVVLVKPNKLEEESIF